MPEQVRAIVVDPAAPGKLAIKPVELRDPDRDEVGVRVTAISLNRGETRRALQVADAGWRPGWDFAGVVETEAADGSGPKCGTRVVGLLPSGAWAERINCRSHRMRRSGRGRPEPRRGQAPRPVLADCRFGRRLGARRGARDAAAERHL